MRLKLNIQYPEKRAFITGGASGIGLSLVKILMRNGWRIGVFDYSDRNINDAKSTLAKDTQQFVWHKGDTRDIGQVKEALDDITKKWGGIDLIINNAGVADSGLIHELSLEQWNRVLDINLKGYVHVTHLSIPALISNGGGHIINISSAASFVNAPKMAAYCISKAGVTSLSESIAIEYRQHNIYVTNVMPTFIRTPLHESIESKGEGKELGMYMVDGAKYEADDVAETILRGAGEKKVHVYGMSESRVLHLLKRWFPGLVRKVLQKGARQPHIFVEAYKRRHEKRKAEQI